MQHSFDTRSVRPEAVRVGFSARRCLAATAIFAVLTPSVARADAAARAYLGDERLQGQVQPDYVRGPTEALFEVGVPASAGYAYAYANLSSGVLRAVGKSVYAPPYVTTTDANTAITDRVTFSSGLGLTAYLDYSFDGQLGIVSDRYNVYRAAFAQMVVSVGTSFGSSRVYETLSAYSGNCGPGCQVGTSTARTGSVAFTIAPGETSFAMGLNGFASWGNSFDFGNTAKFFLRLPDGVGYNSASGNFLASAAPIFGTPVAAVPEPTTYALIMAGLVAVAISARRQRTRGPQL